MLLLHSPAFLLNVGVRIVWSALIASFAIFALALFAKIMGATVSTEQIVSDAFMIFFAFFFGLCFFVLFSFYLGSLVTKITWEPKPYTNLKKKLRRIDLETRRLMANGFKWTGICALLTTFADFLILIREAYVGNESFGQLGTLFFTMFALLALASFGLSNYFMSPIDSAIFHFSVFKKGINSNIIFSSELDKALANYNKSLGSSLPMKNLFSMSQYVAEAHKIGSKEDRKHIIKRIDAIVKSLKKRNASESNKSLIELSELASRITEKHEKILGFKAKYPLKYRIGDAFGGIVTRFFVQFMLLLFWIMILVILGYYGLLPTFPQSPPFF